MQQFTTVECGVSTCNAANQHHTITDECT